MPFFITNNCNGCTACTDICPVSAISGDKKNKHYIDAGLCIECGVCGKVCPHNAVTDPLGQMCTRMKKSAWQIPVFDREICTACGICIETCPTGCIDFGAPQGKEPRAYPELLDENRCISCAFCVNECPVDAVVLNAKDKFMNHKKSGGAMPFTDYKNFHQMLCRTIDKYGYDQAYR